MEHFRKLIRETLTLCFEQLEERKKKKRKNKHRLVSTPILRRPMGSLFYMDAGMSDGGFEGGGDGGGE